MAESWYVSTSAHHGGTHRLSRDEVVAAIDEQAAARRGISASEFVAAYREGRLHEPGEVVDIIGLVNLLDRGDPAEL